MPGVIEEEEGMLEFHRFQVCSSCRITVVVLRKERDNTENAKIVR